MGICQLASLAGFQRTSALRMPEEAVAEVARLHALERRLLLAAGGPQCAEPLPLAQLLSSEHLASRQDVVLSLARVAMVYDFGWDVVATALAFTDAYHLRTRGTGGMATGLAAQAAFSVAVKLLTQHVVDLGELGTVWHTHQLRSDPCAARPQLAAAEHALLSGLDWHLATATAEAILAAFLACGIEDPGETVAGRPATPEQCADARRLATVLCHMCTLNDLTVHYSAATAAAASLAAARSIAGFEPCWCERQQAVVGVPVDALLNCVEDLSRMYFSRMANGGKYTWRD